MAVIYIKEQGASVQKIGERIVVSKNQERLLDIPVFKLENIAVIGNVQITTPALHMLIENGVDVSYLSFGGKYLGSTSADSSKNIFLRFEQYRYFLDEERRLGMARSIVRNKILNQMSVIREHKRKDHYYDWDADLKQMMRLKETLPEKETANEILGVEGMCSNIYFGAFAHMLDCDFEFNGRNRRPPKDPVNVIISLAYTFLTREVSSALDAESFEPYLGFLHGIRYGRKSLALDIVEEFRQPIADRLVIFLFNKRMIGKYDFDIQSNGSVVLLEEGFKKFCREYEKWMTGKNSHTEDQNFRNLLRSQISKLKKAIRYNEDYTPYEWRSKYVSDQL